MFFFFGGGTPNRYPVSFCFVGRIHSGHHEEEQRRIESGEDGCALDVIARTCWWCKGHGLFSCSSKNLLLILTIILMIPPRRISAVFGWRHFSLLWLCVHCSGFSPLSWSLILQYIAVSSSSSSLSLRSSSLWSITRVYFHPLPPPYQHRLSSFSGFSASSAHQLLEYFSFNCCCLRTQVHSPANCTPWLHFTALRIEVKMDPVGPAMRTMTFSATGIAAFTRWPDRSFCPVAEQNLLIETCLARTLFALVCLIVL